MSKTHVELTFGPLADTIADQLTADGFCFDETDGKRWQMDTDAINRLYVRDLVARSVLRKAEQKLLKMIVKGVTRKEGETIK